MNILSSKVNGPLLLAWVSVLMGSALPELLYGLPYPLEPMHWLSLSKAAFFIATLTLTIVTGIRPVRPLLLVLPAIHLATAAFGSIVSSAFWRQLVSRIERPFIRAMLDVQFVRVGITLAVLMVLIAVFRVPGRFYLIRGNMSANASRVPWLGISGTANWNRVGLVLTTILSLGTLTFLAAAMRPALSALSTVIATLPFVVLFSISNALGEEIIYRLGLLAPTAHLGAPIHGTLMSAAYFGFAHYYGIPSGLLGILMAGFLGWLACRSVLDTRGVAWAFLMHFMQDIWIFWFVAATYAMHM